MNESGFQVEHMCNVQFNNGLIHTNSRGLELPVQASSSFFFFFYFEGMKSMDDLVA